MAATGVCLAVALCLSQLSNFMQHYTQNLAGRLAEAERDVAAIIDRADQADLPLYAYLNQFRQADNPVFVREGAALQAKIDRAASLSDSLARLRSAGPLEKPYRFAADIDRDIAADTWRHYEPAVPVDAASLAYASAGAVLGLMAYGLLIGVLGWPVRAVRRRAAAIPPRRRVRTDPHL